MALVLGRGATAVRTAVADYLSGVVPQVVSQARTDWSLDEYQLPLPFAYDAYEPYALDRWPLLGVNVAQAGKFNRVNYHPDMSQQYLVEYTVRVYTWVRTPMDENEMPIEPEYSASIRLRDDLAACVRAALIKSGCLGKPNVILFDEGSLSEEYSETTKVKGDRFVAGVIHSFTIRVDESVPIVPVGTANIFDVGSHLLDEIWFESSSHAVANLTVSAVVEN